MKLLREARGPLREGIESRPIYHRRKQLEREPFETRGFLGRGISAVVQQVMMQIDLHRAGFGACAAE